MELDYIKNMDCLDGLREIPDKSVDCIITDPPYFINMGHGGSLNNMKRHRRDYVGNGNDANRTFGDLAIVKPFYAQLFQEYARVLKDGGHFYFFTDFRGFAFYFPIMQQYLPVKNLIVWDKGGMPGSFYSYNHEFIIFGAYASKLLHAGGGNVWRLPGFNSGAIKTDGEKVHPTQKPVALISKAIEDSTEPGAVVLDTFMGSGTTAVACLRTGRHYIGFELDEQYHAIAEQRVAAEVDRLLAAEEV